MISDGGPGQLSMQAVARAAGMTTGAVQHHFPSKAVLMMQVLSRLIADLEANTEFWPSPRWSLKRRSDHFVRQAWEKLYSQPRFATAWSAYLAARRRRCFDRPSSEAACTYPESFENSVHYCVSRNTEPSQSRCSHAVRID
ncbi:MAG: helix-turn-helix transcriptional regulator [Betaproteobacteria bacterium]|nr:helix-turn-helix transcriptional regulator [Betaproteobacteria bacterium]